jgi:methionine aminopeptidase
MDIRRFGYIDMGVIIDRYCSDITRAFVVGEETAKQRGTYETVLQSTRAGVNTVKSGIRIGDIDIAMRNVNKKAGYKQYFNNRIGQGRGARTGIDYQPWLKIQEEVDDFFQFHFDGGVKPSGEQPLRSETTRSFIPSRDYYFNFVNFKCSICGSF